MVEIGSQPARGAVEFLGSRIPRLPGSTAAGLTVTAADEFHHTDPADGSTVGNQGLRVALRVSGTSTGRMVLKVCLNRFEADESRLGLDSEEALAPLAAAANATADFRERTRRRQPGVLA